MADQDNKIEAYEPPQVEDYIPPKVKRPKKPTPKQKFKAPLPPSINEELRTSKFKFSTEPFTETPEQYLRRDQKPLVSVRPEPRAKPFRGHLDAAKERLKSAGQAISEGRVLDAIFGDPLPESETIRQEQRAYDILGPAGYGALEGVRRAGRMIGEPLTETYGKILEGEMPGAPPRPTLPVPIIRQQRESPVSKILPPAIQYGSMFIPLRMRGSLRETDPGPLPEMGAPSREPLRIGPGELAPSQGPPPRPQAPSPIVPSAPLQLRSGRTIVGFPPPRPRVPQGYLPPSPNEIIRRAPRLPIGPDMMVMSEGEGAIGKPNFDDLSFDLLPALKPGQSPVMIVPQWVIDTITMDQSGTVEGFAPEFDYLPKALMLLADNSPSPEHSAQAQTALNQAYNAAAEQGLTSMALVSREWMNDPSKAEISFQGHETTHVGQYKLAQKFLPDDPHIYSLFDIEWARNDPSIQAVMAKRPGRYVPEQLAIELPAYVTGNQWNRYFDSVTEGNDFMYRSLRELASTYGIEAVDILQNTSRLSPEIEEIYNSVRSTYESEQRELIERGSITQGVGQSQTSIRGVPELATGGAVRAGDQEAIGRVADDVERATSPAAFRRENEARFVRQSQVKADLYHGSMSETDIEFIDPSKFHPDSFFIPGFHASQDPHIASRFAEGTGAMRSAGSKKVKDPKPKVYKLKFDIRNAFDTEKIYSDEELLPIYQIAVGMGGRVTDINRFLSSPANRGWDLYTDLKWHFADDKVKVGEALRQAGYDGFTYLGGDRTREVNIRVFDSEQEAKAHVAMTGGTIKRSPDTGNFITEGHRVWVAFKSPQVKSVTGNVGTFDSRFDDIALSRSESDRDPVEWYHSQLEKVVEDKKFPNRMSAEQAMAMLSPYASSKGVKMEMYEKSGLDELLARKTVLGEQVTKDELLDVIRSNKIVIEETVYGERDQVKLAEVKRQIKELQNNADNLRVERRALEQVLDEMALNMTPDEVNSTFARIQAIDVELTQMVTRARTLNHEEREAIGVSAPHTSWKALKGGIPGTDREIVLRVPPTKVGVQIGPIEEIPQNELELMGLTVAGDEIIEVTPDRYRAYIVGKPDEYITGSTPEEVRKNASETPTDYDRIYTTSHYPGVENPVVHFRIDEGQPIDGEKVLQLQEVQSDLHQKGREEGYDTEDYRQNLQRMRDRIREIDKRVYDLNVEMEKIDESPIYQDYVTANQRVYNAELGNYDLKLGRIPTPRDLEMLDARYQEVGSQYEALFRPIEAEIDRLNEERRSTQLKLSELEKASPAPDLPFKQTWIDLAVKRLIRWAVDRGYKRIVWPTGAMQIDLYESELRKNVDRIEFITLNRALEKHNLPQAKNVLETINDLEKKELNFRAMAESAWSVADTQLHKHYNKQAADLAFLRRDWIDQYKAEFGDLAYHEGQWMPDIPGTQSGGQSGRVRAFKNGNKVLDKDVDADGKIVGTNDKLKDAVGQKIYDHLVKDGFAEGDDISIGGQLHKFVYDTRLPIIFRDYAKKFGGKYEVVRPDPPGDYYIVTESAPGSPEGLKYKIIGPEGEVESWFLHKTAAEHQLLRFNSGGGLNSSFQRIDDNKWVAYLWDGSIVNIDKTTQRYNLGENRIEAPGWIATDADGNLYETQRESWAVGNTVEEVISKLQRDEIFLRKKDRPVQTLHSFTISPKLEQKARFEGFALSKADPKLTIGDKVKVKGFAGIAEITEVFDDGVAVKFQDGSTDELNFSEVTKVQTKVTKQGTQEVTKVTKTPQKGRVPNLPGRMRIRNQNLFVNRIGPGDEVGKVKIEFGNGTISQFDIKDVKDAGGRKIKDPIMYMLMENPPDDPIGPPRGPSNPALPSGEPPPLFTPGVSVPISKVLGRKFTELLESNQVQYDSSEAVGVQVYEAILNGKLRDDEVDRILSEEGMSWHEFAENVFATYSRAGSTLQTLSEIERRHWKRLRDENPALFEKMFPPSRQIKLMLEELNDTVLGMTMWRRMGRMVQKAILTQMATTMTNFIGATGRVPMDAAGSFLGQAIKQILEGEGTFAEKKSKAYEAGRESFVATFEAWKALNPQQLEALTRGQLGTEYARYEEVISETKRYFPDIYGKLLAKPFEFEAAKLTGEETSSKAPFEDIKAPFRNLTGAQSDIGKMSKILLPRVKDESLRRDLQQQIKSLQKKVDRENKTLIKVGVRLPEYLYDQFLRPMQFMEFLMRRARFTSRLGLELKDRGYDLGDIINGKSDITFQKIPPEAMKSALNDALEFTMALEPSRESNRMMEQAAVKLIDAANTLGPLGLVADTLFARAMYSAMKTFYDYSPFPFFFEHGSKGFIYRIRHRDDTDVDPATGAEYNANPPTRDDYDRLGKAMVGMFLYILATILIKEGLIGDNWYELKSSQKDEKGNPIYVDTRKYIPQARIFQFASLADRAATGRLNDVQVGKELLDIFTGMKRFEGDLDVIDTIDATGEFLSSEEWSPLKIDKSAQLLGRYPATFLTPFLNLRSVVAAYDEDENAKKDLRGYGFFGPAIDRIPWVRQTMPDLNMPFQFGRIPLSQSPTLQQFGGVQTVAAPGFIGRELNRMGVNLRTYFPKNPDPLIDREQNEHFSRAMEMVGNMFQNDPSYITATTDQKMAMLEPYLLTAAEIARQEGLKANLPVAAKQEIMRQVPGKFTRRVTGITEYLQGLKNQ